MELPDKDQVDAAIRQSRRLGESEEQLEARIEALLRWSDEELAAIGVTRRDPLPLEAGRPAPSDFSAVAVRPRRGGWTARRQRDFIAALAETGCVSEACAEVGITPRSAYRLREHPDAAGFRAAWDHAQSLAAVRLQAIAWERAIHGAADRLYEDGELVAERRRPSDKLLMWLLAHHHPGTYGWAARPPGQAPDLSFFPVEYARRQLPALLNGIADVAPEDCPAESLNPADLDPLDPPPSRA